MTNPLNKDEDVLASIRRLVSDEQAGAGHRTGAVPRLVLTPALRVYPEDTPASTSEAPADEAALADAGIVEDEPAVVLHIVEDELPEPELVELATSAISPGSSDLARKLADIEALLNAQDEPFEPDAEEAPLNASEAPWLARHAVEIEDEAPFIADAEDLHHAATEAFSWTETTSAVTEEAPLSDIEQDVLRGLVREVLLEELQGPTGERVTRNLRKMVRAEIGRALAARGLT